MIYGIVEFFYGTNKKLHGPSYATVGKVTRKVYT